MAWFQPQPVRRLPFYLCKLLVDEENWVLASWHFSTDSLRYPVQVICQIFDIYFKFGPQRRDGYSSAVPVIRCQVSYIISLIVDQALGCCDDAGCQGILGIEKVTFYIPNYLGPTSSGDFIVWWLIVR